MGKGTYALFLLLGVLMALAAAATLAFPDHPLVEGFGPNLATELLGIIVTLAIVQRFLERQERARRLRASIGGIRKSRRALLLITDTWARLVRGCVRGTETEKRDVPWLFQPHRTEQLMFLDPRAARGEGEALWLGWAAERLAAGRRTLREIIASYGGTLDAAYLEALDELVDDPFSDLILRLAESADTNTRAWRVALNTARGHRDGHFARLVSTLELHNRLAREAARFRSRDGAPRGGTIGLRLASDADLVVEYPMPPEWWHQPPRAGSLLA